MPSRARPAARGAYGALAARATAVADAGLVGGTTRLTWTVDVLPNELAPYISSQMDLGAAAMQKAFAKKAA